MLLLSVAIIASLGNALAADSNLAWDESNIKTLRTLNQADLAALVNLLPPGSGVVIHPEPASIGEFAWTDLQGNGTYQLLMTLDVNGRHFYNSLVIYSRDSSGRLASQEIRGWAIRNLANVTRDIKGDGKVELIVPSQLPSDTYRGAAGMAIWPAVYREKNGQYLEASGEFPSFYESQVLPELDRKIAEVRQKLDKGLATAHDLAIAIMARDKVLRIIGRDPRAGQREARKWMASQDPELRSDAAAVQAT